MRLTDKTDYALRVLMLLTASGRQLTVGDMADALGVSANHLNKVAQALQAHGWVETTRGRAGGVRLAIDPGELTIGEVVRAIETDLALVECERDGATCPLESACALWSLLDRARSAFLDELDAATLRDLVRRRGSRLLSLTINA